MRLSRPESHRENQIQQATPAHTRVKAGAIVLLTLLAYWPALWGGFVWDDDAYVTRNPLLTEPDGLRRIWFTAHKQSQYFPLTFTTLRFGYSLWGLNPVGYHALNIGLHCVNALLVWTVLRRLNVPGAWFAALIFAVHPVQVETVAWITELKNIQSTMFYLLAVLVWDKFVTTSSARARLFYALALLLHALALFSKTTACTLPAALVLVLWLRGQPITVHRIGQVLPFVVLGIGMGLVSVWWEGHLGNYAVESGTGYTLLHRLLIATRALWFYAGKLVLPLNLTFSYPKWHINPVEPGQYIWLLGCITVALILWFKSRLVGPGVIAGVVFFVAALSPLLGFIWLYTFRYSFVADHYQYLACVGLLAPLIGAAARFTARLNSAVRRMFGAALVLWLVMLTRHQAHAYKDIESLWRDTLAKNPASWMAHNNLGLVLRAQGKLDAAETHYREALRLNPDYPEAWNNLGQIFDEIGQLDAAAQCYRRAISLKPNFAEALSNLGGVLTAKGELTEALVHLEKAVQLAPSLAEVHNNLANALRQIGRLDDAIKHYSIALELQPGNAKLYANLGLALAVKGDHDAAIRQLISALELDPADALVHRNLGRVYLVIGRLEHAIVHLTRAIELDPGDARTRTELGDAFMSKGLVTAARTNYQCAIRLHPDNPDMRFKLGYALIKEGDIAGATSQWRTVIELDSQNVNALNSLAWVLATTTNDALRNGVEAVQLATRAYELTEQKNPAVLDTLAAAHAETGSFTQAVQTAERALDLALGVGNERLATQIQKRLESYKHRRPWRE